MTFHSSAYFRDAITAAADALDIRPVLIEKDYWVTFVLKNLSRSAYADITVFKGGTSLSKAYNCIRRFSEDVDLAVIPQEGLSQNQLKKLLGDIDHTITAGLEWMGGDKKGRNRTTLYNYPKTIEDQPFGAVKEHIKIEVNAFTNPVPHQPLPIASYLYQFLLDRGSNDLIDAYELHPFSLNVLSLERTFFEKVLALNRLSYNGIAPLKEKIRHFYDLHQIYHNTRLTETIFLPANREVLLLVRKDDERLQTFDGPWKNQPYTASPLFTSLEDVWKELTPTYTDELANLLWQGELPSSTAVLNVMKRIQLFLQEQDREFR
ncbi:MAG TPA: nucleotidyl transferase AbiEii/AbiGii toxin family protein [Mucilaginibacter sp.]